MSDLLSDAERLEIRAAIHDVTDTFMRSPISYSLAGESVDRFNEDRDDQNDEVIVIMGLVESQELETYFTRRGQEGSVNKADIKVTFNLEVLQDAGLINLDYSPKFSETRDTFVSQGLKYKVVYVGTDGPLTEKNCLVVIYGEQEQKAA